MIELYSGTPGSGKSLRAAYKMINWLNRGKTVIANFPIDYCYFKKPVGKFYFRENDRLTVKLLKAYAKKKHVLGKEHQTLLIIDECASMFNCRCWDDKARAKWILFFQQHRKLGYDVILISQQDRLLDRQIRSFIEIEWKHRALRHYKTFGFLLSLVFGGLFVAVEYWYGPKLRCGSEMFLLNRKKAKIYDTFKIFE